MMDKSVRALGRDAAAVYSGAAGFHTGCWYRSHFVSTAAVCQFFVSQTCNWNLRKFSTVV